MIGGPDLTVEARTLEASDGGRCRLTRVSGTAPGSPVVLLPGMFDSRRLYLWPDGGGLAVALARAGFDAWILERRGIGVSSAAHARAGWHEALQHDLPLAQREVARASGRPAFWLGHSFGGVLLARALTSTLDRDQVAGAVLVASAADPPLLAARVTAAALTVGAQRGMFPARRLGFGPVDEPRDAVRDALAWVRDERAAAQVTTPLAQVDVPLLALIGPHDRIAPRAACERLARAFGGTDRRVQLAGRRQGFRRDHGHESPLLHPTADQDVFPFVIGWLHARTPAEANPPDTSTPRTPDRPDAVSPGRRLRLHAEIPAPPDAVFEVLVNQWDRLWPGRQERIRDGVDPAIPQGARSIRRVHILPGLWLHEEIVDCRSPHTLDYTCHTRWVFRRHRGRVRIEATPTGSRIDYQMDLHTRPWIPSPVLAAILELIWKHHSVPQLRRLLDITPGSSRGSRSASHHRSPA